MSKKKNVTKKTGTTKSNNTVPSAKNVTPEDVENAILTYLDDYTKVRRMSLQLYCSPDRWGGVLLNAKHFAYILHDKDINPDGTPKTPHYHLLLVFDNARYRNGVRNLFDLDGTDDTTINFQKMVNTSQAFQYLRHNTSKAQKEGKHLYDPSEVVCDDINFWEEITTPDTTPNEDFLSDLENLGAKDMALRYGRDYIKNYQRYDTFKRMLDTERQFQKRYDDLTFAERVIRSSDTPDQSVIRLLAQCIGECCRSLTYGSGFTKTARGLVPTRDLRETMTDLLWKIEDSVYDYLKGLEEV